MQIFVSFFLAIVFYVTFVAIIIAVMKSTMRFWGFIVLLFLSLPNGFAQLNNEVFEDRFHLIPERKDYLYFYLDNLNFSKNNEYFNKIVLGRTYFGYQLSPSLVYYPAENVRVQAGFYAWKDFGNDEYSKVLPLFSIKFNKDSLSMTIGNYQSGLSHRLIEPLFEFERLITNRWENGLQIQYHKKHFYADIFGDWQVMIYDNSPFQEQVFAGISAYYRIFDKPNFVLQIPLQFVIQHKGGQINTGQQSLINTINQAVGLSVEVKNISHFLKAVRSDNYWVGYQGVEIDSLEVQTDILGSGMYLNLNFDTEMGNIMFSYWDAENFNSAQGGYLYRSVSRQDSTYTEKRRQLLILRTMSDFKIAENLWLTLRFEPYYDFQNQLFEFSNALYLTYKPSIKIARIKKLE
ncbi:MAG: hypothetical protein EAZ55_00020 [Cytophagales bacterium]|nr:MAG: hypothetical protein EAZ55_00020 [Cytophagales bacterium]